MNVTNKITTRIVSTVVWEFRPGVHLDPAALAEAIKTTPWSLSEGSLDTGAEIDGHHVVVTGFDLNPDEVEILSQELIQGPGIATGEFVGSITERSTQGS